MTFDGALRLWRGPAYEEFAEQRWARAEIVRLAELQLLAAERRAEAALAVGRAAETVAALQAHVTAHPLRENGWRLLALALYRTRRQGDALAALRRARTVLRSELGVDPGEDLRRLEADILDQAPQLDVPQQAPTDSARHRCPSWGAPTSSRVLDRRGRRGPAGRPAVLVSGAAGAGKTALVTALTDRLTARGWTTAWGACPELRGGPGPWTRMRAALGVPDGSAFGAREPVLLIFDDLHWADEETLALLTDLAADPDAGPLLLVATYRSTDISPGARGGARPRRSHRADPGLPRRSDRAGRGRAGRRHRPPMSADGVRIIHTRSDGNPFFVRELARLWDADGDAALHAVPAGVRDVIRQRLADFGHRTDAPAAGGRPRCRRRPGPARRPRWATRRRCSTPSRRPCWRVPGRAGDRPPPLRPRAGARDRLRRHLPRPPRGGTPRSRTSSNGPGRTTSRRSRTTS